MSQISALPPEILVPINQLPDLAGRLVGFLAASGPGMEPATELVRQRLGAVCVQCGQTVSGGELAALAVGSPEPAPVDRRVARLRKGYCVREGCDSLHYQLKWEARAGEDWRNVGDLLQGKVPVDPSPVPAGSRAHGASRRRLYFRLAIGVVILLAALFLKHRLAGGRIPLFEPKYKYQAAPPSERAPR